MSSTHVPAVIDEDPSFIGPLSVGSWFLVLFFMVCCCYCCVGTFIQQCVECEPPEADHGSRRSSSSSRRSSRNGGDDDDDEYDDPVYFIHQDFWLNELPLMIRDGIVWTFTCQRPPPRREFRSVGPRTNPISIGDAHQQQQQRRSHRRSRPPSGVQYGAGIDGFTSSGRGSRRHSGSYRRSRRSQHVVPDSQFSAIPSFSSVQDSSSSASYYPPPQQQQQQQHYRQPQYQQSPAATTGRTIPQESQYGKTPSPPPDNIALRRMVPPTTQYASTLQARPHTTTYGSRPTGGPRHMYGSASLGLATSQYGPVSLAPPAPASPPSSTASRSTVHHQRLPSEPVGASNQQPSNLYGNLPRTQQ